MAAPGSLAQHAVEQAVLSVAKRLEDQLDSQLHKLENLKDDDLERIRQKRVDEMRRQQDQAREWAARGHGQYTELHDERQFFKEVKGEERVVAHFYRDNWPCKVGGWET
jgi:demethoxyubiquinone hydroxylase (CLK1/Coq7/Cat5 family)